jgi:hypothetical protein
VAGSIQREGTGGKPRSASGRPGTFCTARETVPRTRRPCWSQTTIGSSRAAVGAMTSAASARCSAARRGDVHAPFEIERRQQGAGGLGQEPGAFALRLQLFHGRPVGGLLHQPPRGPPPPGSTDGDAERNSSPTAPLTEPVPGVRCAEASQPGDDRASPTRASGRRTSAASLSSATCPAASVTTTGKGAAAALTRGVAPVPGPPGDTGMSRAPFQALNLP